LRSRVLSSQIKRSLAASKAPKAVVQPPNQDRSLVRRRMPPRPRLRDKDHRICGRTPADQQHLRFAQPRALRVSYNSRCTVRRLLIIGNCTPWRRKEVLGGRQYQPAADGVKSVEAKPNGNHRRRCQSSEDRNTDFATGMVRRARRSRTSQGCHAASGGRSRYSSDPFPRVTAARAKTSSTRT